MGLHLLLKEQYSLQVKGFFSWAGPQFYKRTFFHEDQVQDVLNELDCGHYCHGYDAWGIELRVRDLCARAKVRKVACCDGVTSTALRAVLIARTSLF